MKVKRIICNPRGLFFIICSLLFSHAVAQTDPVIMTVAGVDVPRSEFEYSYNKNNTDGVIDKKTVEEYVELFVNYKLKVQAALDARLDTTTAFRQEFARMTICWLRLTRCMIRRWRALALTVWSWRDIS